MTPVIAATAVAGAVVAITALATHAPASPPNRIVGAIADYYAAPTHAIANLHRHDVCNLAAGRTDLAPAVITFTKEHCP